MNNQIPFFSIVIPTFNRESLIKETLESVLAQDFDDYEVIVVDDGSTDSTKKVLLPYAEKIQFIEQVNKGAEQARNVGMRAARGEYLVFLDSDDLLFPYALRVYHQVIVHSSPAVMFARGAAFSGSIDTTFCTGDPVTPEYSVAKDYLSKKHSTWLSTSFIVVNRRLVFNAEAFFCEGTFPVDDLDFMLRAGTLSPCVFIIAPITVGYRLHTSNSVRDIDSNIKKILVVISKERNNQYPGGTLRKFDRLVLIGGHIQCWARKGLGSGYYGETAKLLINGKTALLCASVKWSIRCAEKILRKILQRTGR